MFWISIVVYVLLSLGCGVVLMNMEVSRNQEYRVESNRVIEQLHTIEDVKNFSLASYEYIEEVSYLPASEADRTIRDTFFEEVNGKGMQVLPWYEKEQFLGYIKCIYKEMKYNYSDILLLVEGSLLLMEGILIVYFLYLKKKVIKPFVALHDLPLEIAKGHFKDNVKAEKDSYIGSFLWSMSQLSDTLEVTQKRELELMKEKQKLLLSLSHDIKTPLNLIKLYGKALEDGIYTSENEQKMALSQLQVKASEIEKYVDKINVSSREDLFDFTVHMQDFYLQDLWNKVMITYQEICALRKIELIVQPYTNRLIKGDVDKSKEVIENIFENALKYGDGRRIEVTFYEEDYCQLIRIFNTGVKVHDNEIPHLFDSFFRGMNAQGKQGSGLGLYICRELMRKMDGDLFVETQEDGMAFVLVFR